MIDSIPLVIAVSAQAQTGKGATTKAVRERLETYAFADCSDIARQWAKDRGFPVFEDFVKKVTDDPSFCPDYDALIDAQTVKRIQEHPRLFITGRLPHYFADKAGVLPFKVSLICGLEERQRRAAKDGLDPRKIAERDHKDNVRYLNQYGFELPCHLGDKPHNVHLVVSTQNRPPEEVADIILTCGSDWLNCRPFETAHL